ncbi:protein-disulfide reductase DsbD [Pseudomonas petrae]|uniref:Thiol:disulfide interchange protein DsbD n=1 Tax=Pseudomonas petrae TaxID=2912190 RepID=A0ABS9IA88_9PSED|nr:protein-disulfide reductase DsbD [Pseudomonas petrae]MCF7534828.1 protein-disulfide reductase DsbD [Pseudomonas petrae]MCF7539448.1 protein-disulfide reductase DsbD [Pseudomonas petrae]MCF7544144.1 protein-disulfide reductase DsbD [Pseudomonas petrae]MCF7557335.1 protein-disulfide reductase DsbD [Pseudomonas petrae]
MRKVWLMILMLIPLLAQALPGGDTFPARSGPSLFSEKPDFLPANKAFIFTSEQLESGETRLYWQIADGYYLYQQRLKFEGLSQEQQPVLPTGEDHHDEYFGQQQVYRQALELTIPASASGQIKVSWQGCADAGLCYPPQSQRVDVGSGATQQAGTEKGNEVGDQAEDQALASGLAQRSLALSLAAFFGLGLLLAFTPCSLPMLPILAGMVVGSGAKPSRGFALASIYVLSMALIYAGLGVVAALLGSNLQSTLQQPWLLGSFAALFVLLALPMFGFFELQLPGFLRDRLENAGRQRRGGSLLGAAGLGALSGLMIGPCMTAPLAGALLYIAQSGNALHGALVLFVMGLGMGLPLLLLVTVGTRFLPKPGAWMNLVKGLFGFLLLGTALIMIRPLLADVLWLALFGALLIMFAYSAIVQTRSLQRALLLCAPIGLVVGLWGVMMVVGAAAGGDDPWQPLKVYSGSKSATAREAHAAFTTIKDPQAMDRELAAAKDAGQWVLVDYYADWCVSCKIMEKTVFANAEALQALNGVRLLRLDVTADNDASRALLGRFNVLGPPTLVWIAPDGSERRDRRITGEVDLEGFLQHWQTTRGRG